MTDIVVLVGYNYKSSTLNYSCSFESCFPKSRAHFMSQASALRQLGSYLCVGRMKSVKSGNKLEPDN